MINLLEDRLPVPEVGQAGNAAEVGAGAEGEQQLRLGSQELDDLLLLGGAHGAVDEGGEDLAVRHRLDVRALEVERHGPEDDVDGRGHVEDLLGEVDDRLLAAAAGGAPVEGDLGFGCVRHGTVTSSGVAAAGGGAW